VGKEFSGGTKESASFDPMSKKLAEEKISLNNQSEVE
jgi:hypothetical protein